MRQLERPLEVRAIVGNLLELHMLLCPGVSQPLVQPRLGGQTPRQEIKPIERAEVARRVGKLLEWPLSIVNVVQVFQP